MFCIQYIIFDEVTVIYGIERCLCSLWNYLCVVHMYKSFVKLLIPSKQTLWFRHTSCVQLYNMLADCTYCTNNQHTVVIKCIHLHRILLEFFRYISVYGGFSCLEFDHWYDHDGHNCHSNQARNLVFCFPFRCFSSVRCFCYFSCRMVFLSSRLS